MHDLATLFTQRGGYLTAQEARSQHVSPEQLSRFVVAGQAERVQRGVYRLSGDAVPFGAAEELLELQLRAPNARPCLVSALHLHGLSTTRPAALQLAVPANRQFPQLDAPATEIFYFRPRAYQAGSCDLPVASRRLLTYTAEKTLADLLAYAPRFGREIYLEGLKNYLRHHRGRSRPLLDAAQAAHPNVLLTLQRDLEVLSHDQDH